MKGSKKFPLLITEKSANPKCFKNIKYFENKTER